MAFTVEPGDGTEPLANSYTTVQEWKNYWVDRGLDFSLYTDPDIEVALIRATDYIETQFRNRFYGYRLLADQPLSWPRTYVYVNCVVIEGVPLQVKRATFEYAKRALPDDADLLPDPADTDATGQAIDKSKVKVGPIEKEITYSSSGAEVATLGSYPAADKWLEELMFSGGGVIRA
jgi:hypothetical protein